MGFTQSQYPVQESFGSFEICTQIESGVIAPELMEISLEVILIGGVAEGIGLVCACGYQTIIFSLQLM